MVVVLGPLVQWMIVAIRTPQATSHEQFTNKLCLFARPIHSSVEIGWPDFMGVTRCQNQSSCDFVVANVFLYLVRQPKPVSGDTILVVWVCSHSQPLRQFVTPVFIEGVGLQQLINQLLILVLILFHQVGHHFVGLWQATGKIQT